MIKQALFSVPLALCFALGSASGSCATLSELHTQKNVPCAGCHLTDQVKLGAEVSEQDCKRCHNLTVIQDKYSSLGAKNPHKNHLGEIDCALCHRGHSEFKSYCQECHAGSQYGSKTQN